MRKIHDCSNSSKRPKHKGGGGPVENDVMRYLKNYAKDYGYEFVSEAANADVIITNDIFTEEALHCRYGLGSKKIPLVKRMCAPYWQKEFQDRNEILNRAAREADYIIFITEYSAKQYRELNKYDVPLKSETVVLHWVNPDIFKDTGAQKREIFTYAACATDWSRPEKRFYEHALAAQMFPRENFLFIGKISDDRLALMSKNCISVGYIDEPTKIAKVLNSCHAFLNLTYRDAATKTVPQAISCGLPVIYANSGGVSELVRSFGIPIKDSPLSDSEAKLYGTEDKPRKLDPKDVYNTLASFGLTSAGIKMRLQYLNTRKLFNNMLTGYYSVINRACVEGVY